MNELRALGFDLLTSIGEMRLSAFCPPIVLPIRERGGMAPPTSGVAAIGAISGISATLSLAGEATGTAIVLPPSMVSVVWLKTNQLSVPLRDIAIEPADEHFQVPADSITLDFFNETGDPDVAGCGATIRREERVF